MKNILTILTIMAAFTSSIEISAAEESDSKQALSIADRMTLGARGGININIPVFKIAEHPWVRDTEEFMSSGGVFFSGYTYFDFIIVDYFAATLEVGLNTIGWRNETVTMYDTNLITFYDSGVPNPTAAEPYKPKDVTPNGNIYVHPYDLSERRGGLGDVRRNILSFALMPKGRIPISIKQFKLIPYLASGIQLDLILFSNYEVINYPTSGSQAPIDFMPFSRLFDLFIPIALGVEFDFGYGRVVLDVRFLPSVLAADEKLMQTWNPLKWPLDVLIPGNYQHRFEISLGYALNFGAMQAKKSPQLDNEESTQLDNIEDDTTIQEDPDEEPTQSDNIEDNTTNQEDPDEESTQSDDIEDNTTNNEDPDAGAWRSFGS